MRGREIIAPFEVQPWDFRSGKGWKCERKAQTLIFWNNKRKTTIMAFRSKLWTLYIATNNAEKFSCSEKYEIMLYAWKLSKNQVYKCRKDRKHSSFSSKKKNTYIYIAPANIVLFRGEDLYQRGILIRTTTISVSIGIFIKVSQEFPKCWE